MKAAAETSSQSHRSSQAFDLRRAGESLFSLISRRRHRWMVVADGSVAVVAAAVRVTVEAVANRSWAENGTTVKTMAVGAFCTTMGAQRMAEIGRCGSVRG
ncbi:phospholipase D family protein [Sesbania bispinosa]|nr:phospholipase D family protein [Sesbania bispinosa]